MRSVAPAWMVVGEAPKVPVNPFPGRSVTHVSTTTLLPEPVSVREDGNPWSVKAFPVGPDTWSVRAVTVPSKRVAPPVVDSLPNGLRTTVPELVLSKIFPKLALAWAVKVG